MPDNLEKEKRRGIVIVGGTGGIGISRTLRAIAMLASCSSGASAVDFPPMKVNVGTIGHTWNPIIRAMKAEAFDTTLLRWTCPQQHPKDNLTWWDKRYCSATYNLKSHNMRNQRRPAHLCARYYI